MIANIQGSLTNKKPNAKPNSGMFNSPKPNSAKTSMNTSFSNMTANVNNSLKNMFAPTNTKNSISTNTNSAISENTKNITKNVSSSLSDLFSPVKDSVHQSLENNTSMLTVPVVLGLCVLVVLLIIMIMFRNQVAYLFEVAWNEAKRLYKLTFESENPPGPPGPGPEPNHGHRHEHRDDTLKNAPIGTPMGAGNKPHNAIHVDRNALHSMIGGKVEVFNIADNKYKYSDAEPLCKAYGAELATYDQVKEAWQKGADWCNYGWVKGQAALYPTQVSTYNKLQAGPDDQKGACGVPGVNGGYFDNPDLRFGVNCYGVKPAKSDADERAQMRGHGQTNEALEYDRKVRNYKSELNTIPVSPFNTERWD